MLKLQLRKTSGELDLTLELGRATLAVILGTALYLLAPSHLAGAVAGEARSLWVCLHHAKVGAPEFCLPDREPMPAPERSTAPAER